MKPCNNPAAQENWRILTEAKRPMPSHTGNGHGKPKRLIFYIDDNGNIVITGAVHINRRFTGTTEGNFKRN